MKQLLLFFALLFTTLQYAVAGQFPEIAALYESTTQTVDAHHPAVKTSAWRLWRQTNKIEMQGLNTPTGEVWTRLKDGEVAYTWLLHSKQFAINYAPSDLKAIQNNPKWMTKVSIISPELLNKLTLQSKSKAFDYVSETYSGSVGQYQLEIVWLPELKIPASIKQSTNQEITQVKLKQVYPLSEAPWQRLDASRYEDMDFADIGDNEAHPLAKLYLSGNNLQTIQYIHQH